MNAVALITAERDRQRALVTAGSLRWIASDRDCPGDLKLAALVEEVGEVARAYHDNGGIVGNDLRTELVHVAAVAVAWLEGME